MSAADRDRRAWDANTPTLPEGWTRVPLVDGEDWPWALPDDVAEEVRATVLVEYQPSGMGGWGPAAVWWNDSPHPAGPVTLEKGCGMDQKALIREPLPTVPGAYIQVQWKGAGAFERYVLNNQGRWANTRNDLRHEPFELGSDRIDGFVVLD